MNTGRPTPLPDYAFTTVLDMFKYMYVDGSTIIELLRKGSALAIAAGW